MANLLNEALNGVSALLPLQKITIKQIKREIVNGFPASTSEELESYAHAQPLTPAELAKLGETLKAKIAYKFYINKDLIEVLHFLSNTEAKILWDSKEFEVYSKDDWSQNGWIKVIATAVANV